jgi:parallel beta-helix repeat protein
MTTGTLSPALIFQGYTSNGALNAFGFLATYAAGTATPLATYTDATLATPNTNPVQLNAIGQAAVWLTPGLGYKFVETDQYGNQCGYADQINSSVVNNPVYYSQTPAESTAGVTPVNYAYPPGWLPRYGNNTAPSVTDMSGALTNALKASDFVYAPGNYGPYFFAQSAPFTMLAGQSFYGDGPSSVLQFAFNAGNNIQLSGIVGAYVHDLAIQIQGASSTTYSGAVAINGSTYCKVERVTINGNSACGIFLSSANNNTLRDNDFTGVNLSIAFGQADIYLGTTGTGCSYNLIEGNQCFGGGTYGIMLLTGAGNPNAYNVVTNNRISGGNSGYGICNYSGSATVDNFNQIIGNYVENVTGTYTGGSQGAGIYVVGAGGDVIANNTIHNCCISTSNPNLAPAGIGINGINNVTPVSISGNTVSGMSKYYGIYITNSSSGGSITGNTILQLSNNTTGSPIGANQASSVAVTGNTIINQSAQPSIQFNASSSQSNWNVYGNNVNGSGTGLQVFVTGSPTLSNVAIGGNTFIGGGAVNGMLLQNFAIASVNGNTVQTGAAAAVQMNNCTQTRFSGNSFNCASNQYVFVTSGTCASSMLDESNYLQATGGGITLGANAIDNAATGCNCRSTLSGIPGAGVASGGDVSYNLSGSSPFAYEYIGGTWTGLTIP